MTTPASLFVSHASKDDAAVQPLAAWLHQNGFTDVFIDHDSIVVGARWAEALRDAAGACRVVACVVTPAWLACDDCFGEFKAAWYMGKRIIPLFAMPPKTELGVDAKKHLAAVSAEYQGLDLSACLQPDGTLDLAADARLAAQLEQGLRAAGALTSVGLDPEAFAIDKKLRPMPFLGLAAFGDDDADAALFYGRDAEIAEALEQLRRMRAERERRPFVIVGASGSGKSSLLKAGIIPRLRREAPAWLPLRAFRPGANPLLNFAEAIARTLADYGAHEALGDVHGRLRDAWAAASRAEGALTPEGLGAVQAALEAEGKRLREASARPDASILLSVDQAEELARAEGEEAEALADYLRSALAAAPRWQLAFTIRNDSLPELQDHRRFRDITLHLCDLRALPVFRFESVVQAPAKRYGVAVDARLITALVEAAPQSDALPLLGFALQRLWRQFAAKRVLTREHLDRIGGLTGLVENAAERALHGLLPDQDVPQGALAAKRDALGAGTFVPPLVQINEQGAVIRRIAAWSGFADEQRDLLRPFDAWRLVVRKQGEGRAGEASGGNGEAAHRAEGGTVEVVHEALFREWPRLKRWLEPERVRLEALRLLQLDAATWGRSGRQEVFLNHRAGRLAEAEALAGIDRFCRTIGEVENEYLKACREAERLAAAAEQLWRRGALRMQLAVGALGLLLAGLAVNQQALMQAVKERIYWLTDVRGQVLTAGREHTLKPMDAFKECTDCPEMIVVKAGEFMMGSPETEKDGFRKESPQHAVRIAQPFAVGKFAVTFAEWDACASYGDCDPRNNASGWGRGRQPVINITWDDAQTYVAWLSHITGKNYRLLSEAEWEYVARAGTTTAYYWGDEIGKGNANCDGCGSQWDGRQTAPAGSFNPNGFGLYDMAGNIWQWVADCYTDSSADVASSEKPIEFEECATRVNRGGSWRDDPMKLRAAQRAYDLPDFRNNTLGFRVARTLLTPTP